VPDREPGSPMPAGLWLYHPRGDVLPPPAAPTGETVSILLRTRDRPLMLPRALASILGQHLTDWHLYIVNNAGDPDALEATLAAHRAAFGPRLTVLHDAISPGIDPAHNTALAVARGTYIAIHDDDDTWQPDFLAETTAYLENPTHADKVAVLTHCWLVRERIEGDTIVEIEREPFPEFHPTLEFRRLLVDNLAPPISVVFRRALLERIGPFNPRLTLQGDYELMLRALMTGEFGVIPQQLANYHQRIASQDSIYGNTVNAGREIHIACASMLRNDIIRRSLQDNPANLGVMQAILVTLNDLHRDLIDRLQTQTNQLSNTDQQADNHAALLAALADLNTHLTEIDTRLAGLEQSSAIVLKALRPLRALWRHALPLRRLIARTRGRA
jgi:glycosyltransferase involved in cell wall biosynthesis